MSKFLLIFCTFLLYMAVGAAYFDEWWHADQRVETFFTLPHGLLYVSIFLNGIIILVHVAFQMAKIGKFSPAAVPKSFPLALAGTGSLFQLLAGGFDMSYHDFFGFDVSIWSPPHLLAVFGGVVSALGFALLWIDETKSVLSRAGFLLCIVAAVTFSQFSLSEYFLGNEQIVDRFANQQIYYGILNGLYISFLATFAYQYFKKGSSTLIMTAAFAVQLLVWAIWVPTTAGVLFKLPIFIFIGALVFDYWIIKGSGKSKLLFANIGNGIVLSIVAAVTVGNFSLMEWMYSLVGGVGASVLGYWLAGQVRKTNRMPWDQQIGSLLIFLVLFSIPELALAHGGEAVGSFAPELHPLWVLIEFSLVILLGCKIARILSLMGAKN